MPTLRNGLLPNHLFALYLIIMSKDIAQQPFKDSSITMNWDINFIVFRNFLQAFVKILHITYKQGARELKISLLIFVIINNVNHDLIFHVYFIQPSKHVGITKTICIFIVCIWREILIQWRSRISILVSRICCVWLCRGCDSMTVCFICWLIVCFL